MKNISKTIKYEFLVNAEGKKHPSANYTQIAIEYRGYDDFISKKPHGKNVGIRLGGCLVDNQEKALICLDFDVKGAPEYRDLSVNSRLERLLLTLEKTIIDDSFVDVSMLDCLKSTYTEVSFSGGLHSFFWLDRDECEKMFEGYSSYALPIDGVTLELFNSRPDRQICVSPSISGTSQVNILYNDQNALVRLPDALKTYFRQSIEKLIDNGKKLNLNLKPRVINKNSSYAKELVATLASAINDAGVDNIVAKLNAHFKNCPNYHSLWVNVGFAIQAEESLTNNEKIALFADFSANIPFSSSGADMGAVFKADKAKHWMSRRLERITSNSVVTFGTISEYIDKIYEDRNKAVIQDLENMRLTRIENDKKLSQVIVTQNEKEKDIVDEMRFQLDNMTCLGDTFCRFYRDMLDVTTHDFFVESYFMTLFCVSCACQHFYQHNAVNAGMAANMMNYTMFFGNSGTKKTTVIKSNVLSLLKRVLPASVMDEKSSINSFRGFDNLVSGVYNGVTIPDLIPAIVVTSDESMTADESYLFDNSSFGVNGSMKKIKTIFNTVHSEARIKVNQSKEGSTHSFDGMSMNYLGLSSYNKKQINALDCSSGAMQRTNIIFIDRSTNPNAASFDSIDWGYIIEPLRNIFYYQYEYYFDESFIKPVNIDDLAVQQSENFSTTGVFDTIHDNRSYYDCISKTEPIQYYYRKVMCYARKACEYPDTSYDSFVERMKSEYIKDCYKESSSKKDKEPQIDTNKLKKKLKDGYFRYIKRTRERIPTRRTIIVKAKKESEQRTLAELQSQYDKECIALIDNYKKISEPLGEVSRGLFEKLVFNAFTITATHSVLIAFSKGEAPDVEGREFRCFDIDVFRWVYRFLVLHNTRVLMKIMDERDVMVTLQEKSSNDKSNKIAEFIVRHKKKMLTHSFLQSNCRAYQAAIKTQKNKVKGITNNLAMYNIIEECGMVENGIKMYDKNQKQTDLPSEMFAIVYDS